MTLTIDIIILIILKITSTFKISTGITFIYPSLVLFELDQKLDFEFE